MKLNRIMIASLGAAASTLSLAATASRTAFTDLPAKNFGFIDNSIGDTGGGKSKLDDKTTEGAGTGGSSQEQQQQQGTNEGGQQQQQAQIGDAKQPGSYTPRDQAQQGTGEAQGGQQQQQAQVGDPQQQMGESSDDATTGAGTQAKKADSDLAEGATLAKGSYVGEQQAT